MSSQSGSAESALVRLVRESVIGEDHVMRTPYGERRVTYADYTASGRALSRTTPTKVTIAPAPSSTTRAAIA